MNGGKPEICWDKSKNTDFLQKYRPFLTIFQSLKKEDFDLSLHCLNHFILFGKCFLRFHYKGVG